MVCSRVCVALVAFAALAAASPAPKTAFWKGTPLDTTVEEMRSLCNNDDAFACMKFKVMNFLDTVFKKDSFQLTETVEVSRNNRANDVSARSESSLEDKVEEYIQTHDVKFNLPIGDASVTMSAQSLEKGDVDLKLHFSESSGEVQARKSSRLKKIIVPIFIFVLLKAITLIPLALGVLGLKAWNALQLSFFSFVVSIGLAVFQLCKKIAADNAHPQIAAHGPWDSAQYSSHYSAAARSLDANAQRMAYAAQL